MNGKKRGFLVAAAAMALLALGAACTSDNNDPAGTSGTERNGGTSTTGSTLGPLNLTQAEQFLPPQYAATARSLTQSAGAQSQGIFVSGTGRVAVDPDLAILRLGIEVQDETVSAALRQGSAAMAAVTGAVKGAGVEDRDIQTQQFSIQPIYSYQEVISREGAGSNNRVLDGYRVTNTVAVKVRDLDSVSEVIDGAANASGDDVRIDGISFTLEDLTEARAQARAEATRSAVTHAQQIADAVGIALGKPISLSESGASQPVLSFNDGARLAFAESMDSAAPIEAGELEVVVGVSVVFAIP
jgi:uncharacterized protein YggE